MPCRQVLIIVKVGVLARHLVLVRTEEVVAYRLMKMLVLMTWLPLGCLCFSCVSSVLCLLRSFRRRHLQALVEVKVVFVLVVV